MVLKNICPFKGLCLSLAATLCTVAQALAVEVDAVAARVGTEAILKSDIVLEMQRMNAPQSAFEAVRAEMIDRKLILRAALESKMTIQEWVIENRIREIIKSMFEGDRNKLVEFLSLKKMSYPEWRERMKNDMVIQAMKWNVVDKNVSVGPQAMRNEYESHPERYAEPSIVTVSVILLKPEDASKRDEVASALKKEPFSAVAKRFSSGSRASEGGLWKDINPADVFKPAICEEISKMPRHTISNWIELDGWSFLLKKESETPGKRLSFIDAYSKVEENVRKEAAAKSYSAWIERLRADTYIKIY